MKYSKNGSKCAVGVFIDFKKQTYGVDEGPLIPYEKSSEPWMDPDDEDNLEDDRDYREFAKITEVEKEPFSVQADSGLSLYGMALLGTMCDAGVPYDEIADYIEKNQADL